MFKVYGQLISVWFPALTNFLQLTFFFSVHQLLALIASDKGQLLSYKKFVLSCLCDFARATPSTWKVLLPHFHLESHSSSKPIIQPTPFSKLCRPDLFFLQNCTIINFYLWALLCCLPLWLFVYFSYPHNSTISTLRTETITYLFPYSRQHPAQCIIHSRFLGDISWIVFWHSSVFSDWTERTLYWPPKSIFNSYPYHHT